MRSIRAKLILGVSLGTTVVLVASGLLLHVLISRALWASFDEALAAKVRSLAALTEIDEDGLNFEPVNAPLPEFAAHPHAEYFELWLVDGTVFARSTSLADGDLNRLAGSPDVPAFQSAKLPDGRQGRLVGLTFVPRLEFPDPDAAPARLTLVVGREVESLLGTLVRVRDILVLVSLIAVLSSAAILAWVVRRGLRPIHRLTDQIAEVGEDELATRIDGSGIPNELRPVVDRLNDLLARLEAAFQRERRLTGDVAHELRTPLAGLRAQLELALSRDRTADVYRKTVSDCLQINLHMQRMVEILLHLARADAGQLQIRREPVDLHQLLRDTWRSFEEKAKARGLGTEWRLGGGGTIDTDQEMLRLVIHNILDNVTAHTNDNGRVIVSSRWDHDAVELEVSNTGCTLSAGQVQQVFQRFWRGDSSFRPTGEVHCGLGLALSRTVIEQLDGFITASTDPAGLFTISIRLPIGNGRQVRGTEETPSSRGPE